MKSLLRVVMLGFILGLVLGNLKTQADTAYQPSRAENQYIDGTTLDGRTGMFFTGAAEVAALGHGNITGGFNYNSYWWGTITNIPVVGINYGVVKNLELAASLPFQIKSVDSENRSYNGLDMLSFGGKYLIPADAVSFAAGLDVSTGPFAKKLNQFQERGTDINPKGLMTYKIQDNIVLNGELGFVIGGKRGVHDYDDFFQLKGGVGYAFTPKFTGIAELAINQYGSNSSSIAIGGRTGTKTKFQGMLGIGLGNYAPDFTLGGAVVFGI
jgi:hypothetical protein